MSRRFRIICGGVALCAMIGFSAPAEAQDPPPDDPPPPGPAPDAPPPADSPGPPPGPGPDAPPPRGPPPDAQPPPGPGPGVTPPPAGGVPGPGRRFRRRRSGGVKRTAHNTLFVELGGPGGAYSINYERMLPYSFGVRAGISYLYVTTLAGFLKAHVLFIPLAVSANLGRRNHAFELALGGTITYCNASAGIGPITFMSEKGTSGVGTFSIGYRYQPRNGGIQIRFGFTGAFGPGFGLGLGEDDEGTEKWRFLPWAYASLGWTF